MDYIEVKDVIDYARPALAINVIENSDLKKYYDNNPHDEDLALILNSKVSTGIPSNIIIYLIYKYLIKNNHINVINYNIANGSDNSFELWAICFNAISQNRIDILKLFIPHKYDFNKKIYNCTMDDKLRSLDILTPLTYSCAIADLEIIEFLINSGADINYHDGLAFHYICTLNRIPIVNYLLQFPIDSPVLIKGFINACSNNNLEIIDSIIAYGFDIGTYSQQIYTHLANKAIPKIMQNLVNHGLILDSNEPLKLACAQNNVPLAKFYLDYGLNIDSDILSSVLKKANIPLLKLFLNYNIDFSMGTICLNTHDEFVNELEQHGLNIKMFMNYLIDIQNCKAHPIFLTGESMSFMNVDADYEKYFKST